ncbi:hypothetical protein MBLNU13_g02193t2 [Cladosporium sp. NU13]
MALSAEQQLELQTQLQRAVIECNERCLYFAAKWSAELLNSFAPPYSSLEAEDADDTDVDEDVEEPISTLNTNPDRREARLEAKELPRYLLAKSFFDCRESSIANQAIIDPESQDENFTGRTTLDEANHNGTA